MGRKESNQTNYTKTCPLFLHAHYTETIKVVQNLSEEFKACGEKLINGKNIDVIGTHYRIASRRQFQCIPTIYITENNENYFEFYSFQDSPL